MKDFVTQGHDTIIMASNASEQHLLEFSSLGARRISSLISGSSLNSFKDINVCLKFLRTFILLMSVTAKF